MYISSYRLKVPLVVLLFVNLLVFFSLFAAIFLLAPPPCLRLLLSLTTWLASTAIRSGPGSVLQAPPCWVSPPVSSDSNDDWDRAPYTMRERAQSHSLLIYSMDLISETKEVTTCVILCNYVTYTYIHVHVWTIVISSSFWKSTKAI